MTDETKPLLGGVVYAPDYNSKPERPRPLYPRESLSPEAHLGTTMRGDGRCNSVECCGSDAVSAVTVVEAPNSQPTHRCKVCGALWWRGDVPPVGLSWSLRSPTCGPCCDNVVMGDQIEPLAPKPVSPLTARIRAQQAEVVDMVALALERDDARARCAGLEEQLATARERARTAERHCEAKEQTKAGLYDALSKAQSERDALKQTLKEVREGLALWSCPDCAFTYDARHHLADGTHSCPNCGEEKAESERDALKARVEALEAALRTECEAFDFHVGTGGQTLNGYTQELWRRNRDLSRGAL